MISSAAAGMPLSPSRVETMPSCMAPPAERVGSSQWSATGMPKVRAYSSAVRIRWLETTGLPSSLTATAPGPDQLAELGELLPLLAQRDRADGIDPRLAGPLRLAHDEADRRLVVGHRIGVGHGADRGEAAGRRGHRAGGDGLEVLLARLAQVHVQVDQPGRDHLAGGVEDRARRPGAPRSRPTAATLPSAR